MAFRSFSYRLEALAIVFVLGLVGSGYAQLSLGTAFTYQGSLKDGGNPASGAFDFQFALWDSNTTGTQQGSTVTVNDLAVANGLFSTPLDFGEVFNGEKRWLEIGVRAGASSDPYTILSPRTELTATPYAMFAKLADTATTASFAASATDSDTVGGMSATQLQDNRQPVAILEASRYSVVANSLISGTVEFNLNHSYDPESGALMYGFDPTGEFSGQPIYDGSPTSSFSYQTQGTYVAEGWVRDGANLYAVDKVTISAEPGGFIGAIDLTGFTGHSTSLQVVNGNPAISYVDPSSGSLRYIRANDEFGRSWGPPIGNIELEGIVGPGTSLEIISGNPAISYYRVITDDLMFVRASDASGTTWDTPIVVDTTGTVGWFSSLADVAGNPAISYYDVSNGDLKFVRAIDFFGTTWGLPMVIDSAGSVGEYTSLAMVNGAPAIAYYDGNNQDLKYVRATNASGMAWETPLVIDSADEVGAHASLLDVNSHPAIAYYDETNDDLKFVRANDISGTTWGVPIAVDTAGSVGTYTSLAIQNSYPAISYYDSTNGDLKYVRANDFSGTTWGVPIAIDTIDNVGLYSSLAIVNGFPAISYQDGTNGDLKYVR